MRELKNRLLAEQSAANFEVLLLPKYATNQAIHEGKAYELLVKTKGHLMLYGFARSRILEGKDTHVLQLEGIVRHAPLPKEIGAKLGQEFCDALPRRLILPKDGDVFAFEVSSDWTDLGVRYVIGIAAHLSGDLYYAEKLYLSVENRIKRSSSPPAYIQPIARELPKHLVELYEAWRSVLGRRYSHSRQRVDLERLDAIHTKLLERSPNHYGASLGKAIAQFELNRDIGAALKTIKAIETDTDGTWRYSLAFLLAYQGDLKEAHDEYRRAFKSPIADISVPLQCEAFIHRVLEAEPAKRHLLFCTALINYNIKRDLTVAKSDFETFLSSENIDSFPWAKQLAQTLLPKCVQDSSSN